MDTYHQKYADQSDEEIQNKLEEKKSELINIFTNTSFRPNVPLIKLAVLGCGDKRFIQGHKKIFEEVFGKPVEVTTFDITIDHLQGENGVIKHDCTLPLPGAPFTITYAHVLLKFIETEKQWGLIKNSYDALETGGVAIHIMDNEDYETVGERLPSGYFTVPLKRWTEKLSELGIKYQKILIKYGSALILTK